MQHNKKKGRLETQTCLFLSAFLLLLLVSSCGGIVPPPVKKAGTAPQDKPLVVSTVPADKEGDVKLNRSISIIFSKEMSSATLNNTNILLDDITDPAVPVRLTGSLTPTGATAVFKPAGNLKGSTPFKVTVTQGVQDTFGNSLAEELIWTFTSIALSNPGSIDTDPPFVVTTNPGDGETNVSVNASITVTFNEAIDPTTVTTNTPDDTDTFDVSSTKAGQDIVPSNGNRTFTFIPDTKGLDFGKNHIATITTGVKDLAGNPLSAEFTWSFTVEDPDPTGGID